MADTPLTIDVVSDVVCPWCFIGKRRLEKALAQIPDVPVEIRWRPYFLNPWVPAEGISRADYLTTKFGSVDRYMANAPRMVAAAAGEGLTYAIDKIARQPNTRDCHRLILWAGAVGKAAEMKQRLMELYFTEGADLSDREVQVAAAVDVGLEGERVRGLLASDTDVARVEAAARSAAESGIEGVPFYIFGGVLAVSGAQTPEHLIEAIRQAQQHVAEKAGAAK